jgi:hypothetical protein
MEELLGVTNSSHTPPLVEVKAPLLGGEQKYWSRIPTKLRITLLARASNNLTYLPTDQLSQKLPQRRKRERKRNLHC